MLVKFNKKKVIDEIEQGDFYGFDNRILHEELVVLLGEQSDSQRWHVNTGDVYIHIFLKDESLFQYEQQIKDLVENHGSQEAIDARTAAEQAEEMEITNLKGEMETLVENLSYTKVDTHIDNVFGNLTTGQKNSLKNLYKVVLYLAKR